jgi:amyloid beta precursor protein binding protein 1
MLDNSSNPFWFVVYGIAQFMKESGGTLPVSGSLPDMHSTSDMYISLQQVFQRKAKLDREAVQGHIQQLLSRKQLPASFVTEEFINLVCTHFRSSCIMAYTSISEEYKQSSASTRASIFEAFDAIVETCAGTQARLHECQQSPILWYMLLQSRENFHAKFHRYPGESTDAGSSFEEDASNLYEIVLNLVHRVSIPVSTFQPFLTKRHCDEIVRFANIELHVVAALLGGVAAQESVKIITGQYVPIKSTYVYNSHGGFSEVFDV